MRKISILIVALFLSMAAYSQTAAEKTKCTGITKAGNPCRNNAKPATKFCALHNPDKIVCGAPKKDKTPCKMGVNAKGVLCHYHKL